MPERIETKVYETILLKGGFDDQGIFIAEITTAEHNEKNYKLLFDLYKNVSENGTKKLCLLCNISKSSPMNKKARELMAMELPKYIKAMVLMSDSAVGKMIGTTFIMLTPQKFPTRIYSSETEAKEWLKQYL